MSEATISQLYVDPETHAIKVMTSHGDTGNSNGPHLTQTVRNGLGVMGVRKYPE